MAQVTARLFQGVPGDAAFGSALTMLSGLNYVDRTLERPLGGNLYGISAPQEDGIGLWSLRQGADIHQAGVIQPWNLPSDIAEGSYFRWFDGGTVVMLATGHGPRATAFSLYFDKVAQLDVLLNPVVRVDETLYLASLDNVKRIEMTLTGESAEELRHIDETLGSAVASLAATSNSNKLKLTFDGTDADSRDQMWGRSRGWLADLIAHGPMAGLDRLHVVVRGEISGEEDIDVLKDKIAYQMEVPHQGLDIDTAFGVAARAYDRFRNELG